MSWFASDYIPIQAGSIDGTDTSPHDRGIKRACEADYDALRDKKIKGDPYSTLFVGRLSFETTENDLIEAFSRFGRIKSSRLVRDIVTGMSCGYGFIEFEREDDFRAAYRSMNRATVGGREIFVDYERERVMKGWVPRRHGGGFGGRKESGQLRFGGRDRPFKTPIRLPGQRDDLGRGDASLNARTDHRLAEAARRPPTETTLSAEPSEHSERDRSREREREREQPRPRERLQRERDWDRDRGRDRDRRGEHDEHRRHQPEHRERERRRGY